MKDCIMNKEYILHKWLNNSATEAEIEELKSSPEYADYMKIAEISSSLEAPPVKTEGNYKAIAPKLFSATKVRSLSPIKGILKIAAVFAVLLTGYLYVDSLGTSIETTIAEKQTFLLPDNSEVALNSNSILKYNMNMN